MVESTIREGSLARPKATGRREAVSGGVGGEGRKLLAEADQERAKAEVVVAARACPVVL